MEFLEVLDRIEGELGNSRSIFARESAEGVRPISTTRGLVRGRRNPVEYKRRLAEAVKLVSGVIGGSIHPVVLREVMTTDDFPLYFGDILDRTLLATYQNWPAGWEAFAKRAVVNDFRDAKLIPPMFGADGPLEVVEEGDQYPEASLSEQAPILWRVNKYGRRVPFTWETLINDDLDQLKDIPARLARAARRTEHRLVTALVVDANGPHASLYTVANKNIINTTNGAPSAVGDNPPLSINALQAAYIVLSKMVDETGEPIFRDMMTLVVPPALEVTAQTILNATTIFDSSVLGGGQPDDHAGSGERMLQVNNWMRNRLRLVVDPYIPTLATSANGNTTWFLFANPNTSREAIRIGFLRGHESPEIWMKSPNAVRVGGGDVSPMSGDFDTDSVEYRVRHVTGVTLVDPKATVASNGSGT